MHIYCRKRQKNLMLGNGPQYKSISLLALLFVIGFRVYRTVVSHTRLPEIFISIGQLIQIASRALFANVQGVQESIPRNQFR
jgi:hypothetical protein